MVDTKNQIRFNRPRRFLVKDFEGFRIALTQYARTFWTPEKLNDLSETGFGGMFIELASYVGDNMSFYLDHQFAELDTDAAVETGNIERHLRQAGVDIKGASPATVNVTFAFEVDAERVGSVFQPKSSQLPVVVAGTVIEANNGTRFELTEDIDFTERTTNNELVANVVVSATTVAGTPSRFIITRTGLCISGFRTTETFTIPTTFKAFRTLTLGNENVTEIVAVRDAEGNNYYEVESLTQDTVFRRVANLSNDRDEVADNLELLAAPYRFTTNVSLDGRVTTLRFGSGEANSFDIDNIPDPSELALPLFGRKTFPRFTLDPASLLQTSTLGVAPVNTTLTVDYRYGGGLSHNAPAGTLRTPVDLRLLFPNGPSAAEASRVRSSIGTTNVDAARGGEPAPTVEELRAQIPAFRNAQSRVVTAPDLLARVYTLPSNFGRVFRAGVRSNPNNPLATQLHVISRDAQGRLTPTPDSLKLNLRQYLNPFRMISDAVDVLDASVVNIQIEYQVAVSPTANRPVVIQTINQRLRSFFDIRQRQIDQPISLSDVRNLIFNNTGVISVTGIKVRNLTGIVGENTYSNVQYDVQSNIVKDHIFPPPGGIFEVKFPDIDIIGSAV